MKHVFSISTVYSTAQIGESVRFSCSCGEERGFSDVGSARLFAGLHGGGEAPAPDVEEEAPEEREVEEESPSYVGSVEEA